MTKHSQKIYSKIIALTTATFLGFFCWSNDKETVTVALSQMPLTLNPLKATDATGMRIVNLIFQSLVYADDHLNIQPDLAQSWSCRPLTCTFEIPHGNTFSNGRPLQAEDIKFSFEQYQSPKSPFHSAFQNIKSTSIHSHPQGLTVQMDLKKSSAPLLSSDLPVIKILPKKEFTSEKFKDFPLGSGPFVLTKKTSHQIELKSRSSTKIKTVIFKVIRDDLTRFQKILKKDIDIVPSDLPYSKVKKIKEMNTPYKVLSQEGRSMNYILINFKDPLFSQLKARKALALGINRFNIVQYHMHGFATPAHTILTESNPFFFKSIQKYSHNKKKAQKILETHKWKGKKIRIKTSNNQSVLSYAKIIAYQLEQIGFQVELESYEWGTFYNDLNKGNFQLALLRWVGAFDPDIYRIAFHSSQIPPYGRNRGSYINSALDQLLEQGREQTLLKKRKTIYHKVQEIIAQELPIIPLWHNQQVSIVKTDIQDYSLPFDGSYHFLLSISKK